VTTLAPRPVPGQPRQDRVQDPGRELATGLVLVGTAETVRSLSRQLAALDLAGPVLGCALVGPPGPDPGMPVLGALQELPSLLHADAPVKAIVTLPASMVRARAEAERALAAAGIEHVHLPPLPEVVGLESGPPVEPVRQPTRPSAVDLGLLLDRPARSRDREFLARVLTGRRVLITGAGGSIGSELALLAASLDPEELVLMERGENPLFEIDRRLGERFAGVRRRAVLHDVVEREATQRLVALFRPHVVFHAAAHKHVPLMEDHPAQAVRNNVLGTRAIADAAVAAGARRFVLISSDKAVNPVSVMGATKRLAELYVHAVHARVHAAGGRTRCSMVRFGNVLGSASSVLTIWSSQIAEGGPITITDPAMTRYFMTIPEAAALVTESAGIDPPPTPLAAPVFVLDMGQPVRIVELARRFARAHGFEPALREDGREPVPEADGDLPGIEIVVTGKRPGEKTHEELAYRAEHLVPSGRPGIHLWRAAPTRPIDGEALAAEMERAAGGLGPGELLRAIREQLEKWWGTTRTGGEPIVQ
jgi:FlaA1/EpsC-like NDP-sugar epimerase